MAQRFEMERLVRLEKAAIESGDPRMAIEAVGPEFHNREAAREPAPCRQRGPAGLMATSAWLRAAFSDLHYHERELLVDGDRVIWWGSMSGRHDGPFVVVDGERALVFPATGAQFEVEQVHLHRFEDGRMVEHRAVRDDLGLMRSLGYLPPTPAGMRRMVASQLTGAAGRSARTVTDAAARAAEGVTHLLSPQPRLVDPQRVRM